MLLQDKNILHTATFVVGSSEGNLFAFFKVTLMTLFDQEVS